MSNERHSTAETRVSSVVNAMNERRRSVAKIVGFALGLTVLWAVLAAARPTVTYHLAPLLVAAVPGFFARFDDSVGLDRASFVVLTAASTSIALAATGVLAVAGGLMGPSLLPFGGAALEGVVGIAIGAIIGLTLAGSRPLVTPAVPRRSAL